MNCRTLADVMLAVLVEHLNGCRTCKTGLVLFHAAETLEATISPVVAREGMRRLCGTGAALMLPAPEGAA